MQIYIVMITANFYLDIRSKKKNGMYPIKVNIFHKKQILISTGIDAYDYEWETNQLETKKNKNNKYKNAVLNNIMSSIQNEILSLQALGSLQSMSDKDLKRKVEIIIKGEEKVKPKVFIDYIDDFILTKKNQKTKVCYGITKKKIIGFDKDCTFDTIDRKWLLSFENWMVESGMKINAYAIHLRNIRAVFNYAIDEEETTLYPFRRFKIKKEETKKRSLSIAQLRAIKDYPCEEYEKRYRDLFMLSFYLIGINIGDLLLLKPSDVNNGRISYHRQKTNKLYDIKMEPEALDIINKYKGKNYLLNVMDEYSRYDDFVSRMNKNLKTLGPYERKGRGGKKIHHPLVAGLSTYWARHTWATVAASLDIPKETISAALGHEIGSDVTSIYINFDMKKVDEANRKVIDYVIKED